VNTTNGGQSWSVQQSNTYYPVDDMNFVDRSNGWIVLNNFGSSGSLLLHTTNGGGNWNIAPNPDTTSYFMTVYFLDTFTGFVAGLAGSIFKTTNSGSNWNKCALDSSLYYAFPIRKLKFYDSQIGFACGGQYDYGGVLWMTTNGGLNWSSRNVSPEPDFDIRIINPNKIMLAGGDFEYGAAIVTSLDRGSSWRYEATGCYGVGRAVAMRTPTEIWVPLSFSQMWAVSRDSGALGTWFCVHAPDTTSVYDATFISPTFGWAVGCIGYNCIGTIMKYNTAIIGITGNQSIVPDKLSLLQNYPNPFNPSTQIKFYLPETADVNLSVFDLTGKLVKTLANSKMERGYHEQIFESNDLASGVYIYSIKANSSIESKKMVLIK